MKSLPNIAAACLGLAAGAMLVIASREGQTQASIPTPTESIILTTTEVDGPCPWVEPEQQPAPQPVPSVDACVVVASASVSGECANGVCAPRAAVVAKHATTQRYQPQTRRGLFGGRLFGRR